MSTPLIDVPHVPRSPWTTPVLVALLTVYVVWGSTYYAIRLTLDAYPPFFQGGVRFLVAGVGLFAFLRWRGRPLPSARHWRDGAVVGVLLLVLGNGGVVFAEQYVSSSVAAIFIGVGPLVAALWTGFFGVWPRPVQWVGILLGFGGVCLLASGSQLAGQPLGLISLMIACTCWTLGSVLAQRKLVLAPGAMGFATEMIAGGLVMLLVAFCRGETTRFAASWPPTGIATLALGYLIVAGSLAAFSAYMYLLSQVSSSIAISYAYVNPIIAVLLGVALGGETLAPREAVATAIIVGSVILLTRDKPRAAVP
jgi:drug/metabolite transporter (DMT)-like permease